MIFYSRINGLKKSNSLCIEAFISLFFIKLSKNDRLLSIGYRILYLSVRNEEEPQ